MRICHIAISARLASRALRWVKFCDSRKQIDRYSRPLLIRRPLRVTPDEACAVSPSCPSPTRRRSIPSISCERSPSAAAMAAIVCCNVLTFDPSDTMPPSTAAIAPMATIGVDPSKPSSMTSSKPAPAEIATFDARMIFRQRSAMSPSSSSSASIREISSIGSSSPIRTDLQTPGGARLRNATPGLILSTVCSSIRICSCLSTSRPPPTV